MPIPDLLVALDAEPELYDRNNGYVVSEQGKPPGFVLEAALPGTKAAGNAVKRDFYARHGVGEYWRFDELEEPGSVKLAGDRLADGRYEPLPVTEPADGVVQGYSAALKLHLCWERGELRWRDPETGDHIGAFDSERAHIAERDRRIAAVGRADREREVRIVAVCRAEAERRARLAAGARVRELERILSQRDS